MPTSNGAGDGDVSTAPGAPPRFARSLIAALDLSQASPEEREQGVAHWLRHNIPDESCAAASSDANTATYSTSSKPGTSRHARRHR
uniref:hypothetical protein n=1 Tax=Rhodococcus erythropolis TaxID=1833 RepID=UPI000BB34962|nr:hypothetical protein [Rhodococcus erythropolis]